jgi:signal transduction histidine kinase/DNA-binding response OmpR family regulator
LGFSSGKYQMSSAPKSLTRQTLIKMGMRIAIVILLITFVSYWLMVSALKSQSLEQLEKYIIERGQRESSIFQLAQDNHALLKNAFYQQLEKFGAKEPSKAFEQLFVQWADGTTRNKPKDQTPEHFDTTQYPSVYIGKQVNINADIQRRVLTFYHLLSHYGPAWRNRFVDTYFLAPENIAAIYWPNKPWALNATADLNIQNEEYFYVSDKAHNPERNPAWTGLYFDHVVKLWMVSLETPIDDAQGHHIATIGNDIILNELMQRTIHDTLEGAYNLILRKDGRLIAHPDKITQIQEQDGQFDILQSGDPHLIRTFEFLKNSKPNQIVIQNTVDKEYLAITKIVGPEWFLVTVYPQALLSGPAFKTASFILILGLLSLLIEVLILFWVLRTQVAKPLQEFIFATQTIASGHFSLENPVTQPGKIIQGHLPLERSDELGHLAHSFHSMAGQLKTLFSKMATKNTELKAVIEDIVQISQGLAVGNLQVMPQAEYKGDLLPIKIALEKALSHLRLVTTDIIQVSQGLAEGNLQIKPNCEYQGDFLQIENALQLALSELRQVIQDIIQVSQKLAEGDFSVPPQSDYPGDFDQIKRALEVALFNQRLVIQDIVQFSQGITEGNLNVIPEVEYIGEFIQIKTALETASVKLVEATAQNARQDWLKTGQAQLNEQMSGEQDMTTLAKNIIAFLTSRLEAQAGLFYLVKEINRHRQQCELLMIANYTLTQHKDIAKVFQFGEGIVGQAALDKQTIPFTIHAGLNQAIPRHLLAVPFLYEDVVKGVIELGFVEEVTETQLEFLNQVRHSVGIAVNTAQSRTQMQTLLEQSQEQSEKLKFQQEELQHTNEELQAQSEELQTQQEELRQANEELEEHANELQRQKQEVQSQNIALEKNKHEMETAQVALETKAKELELASKYKSEFLANMSHELRTPLNSLLILAQLLVENKTGNLSEKQVEYAQTIYSSGSYLLTLINDILDLSKVEAGKMEIHTEPMSLPDLMTMIEHKFRYSADEKGLAFQVTVAQEVPKLIYTDPLRLQQIINNLLSNAFKFTQQGEVQLMVQRGVPPRPLGEGGGYGHKKMIIFSVSDTGIGIPQEKQEMIFRAFQQADGTTSRSYGGTGLGLSISRQLARLLGGELQLHSEEGKGSLFTLYLPEMSEPISSESEYKDKEYRQSGIQNLMTPLSQSSTIQTSSKNMVNADADNNITQTQIADDRETLQSTDKSLLIIEDDRQFSKLLMELARKKAFKCLVAEDGKTGLQLAEQFKPQAIILDVKLPDIDGWTVMDKLQNNRQTQQIPVHIMSACDPNINALDKGAIGYLHKPVSMLELGEAFQKIEQFMTKQVRNLLVIADNERHQQKILSLLEDDDIQTTLFVTIAEVLQNLPLHKARFDCIILDMDIEQGSGVKLLEQMQQTNSLCLTPVIIYVERDLTSEEEATLQRCAEKLMVKALTNPERLLDEALNFLHQLEAQLPLTQRNLLRMVHDKAAILRDKKVLIVDDDVRNTYALATILEEREMEVVVANNGSHALELLEKHSDVAIVLMDVMMPKMDGYEAIHEIRAQPRYRHLPIIALTAKAMKGDKAKCIDAGASDYLSKPVDNEKLISLMRVWLYR